MVFGDVGAVKGGRRNLSREDCNPQEEKTKEATFVGKQKVNQEVKLLERIVTLLKEDEVDWESTEVDLDKKVGVLNIFPLCSIVVDKGTYLISFQKDAVPIGVSNLTRLFERNGLRYELYEHFRYDEEKEEIVWESDDKDFWKSEERKTKEKEVKEKEENLAMKMYG